jgi:hypothetical protein
MRRCRDRPSSNLSYTTIVSPIDGVVGNRTLRVGQYVQAGTPWRSCRPPRPYIIANYKETQLTNVRRDRHSDRHWLAHASNKGEACRDPPSCSQRMCSSPRPAQ